jgi:hypothetical protein
MEIDCASGGEIVPAIDEIRVRMGKADGWTTPTDWKRAYESYRGEASLLGIAFPDYEVIERGEVGDLWGHLERGDPVGLVVNYGVLRSRAPNLVADPDYAGHHALWLRSVRRRDAERFVLAYDPLADGRRGLPRGPSWWRWADIRDAAKSVTGTDSWTGTVLRLAPVLERIEND